MASGILYSPVVSWLHRANPLTKLCGLVWIVSLTFVLPPAWVWGLVGLILLWALILGMGSAVLKRFAATALPFVVSISIVQALFIVHPDARPLFGPLSISDIGLAHAISIGGRVAAIIAASLVFVASTHPSVLLRAFDQAGWPPALAYLFASPLLMIETFGNRARAIRDAQATRGLRLKGRFLSRVKSIPALVAPLVTTALIEADERAHVLAGRGFRAHGRRTTLEPVADAPFERPLRILLLALAFLQIAVRLWL